MLHHYFNTSILFLSLIVCLSVCPKEKSQRLKGEYIKKIDPKVLSCPKEIQNLQSRNHNIQYIWVLSKYLGSIGKIFIIPN